MLLKIFHQAIQTEQQLNILSRMIEGLQNVFFYPNLDFVQIGIGIATVLVVYWYATTPRDVPPGPASLPVVGYLPFIGKNLPHTFDNLGRRYGKIFSLYLGSRLFIVLNDLDAIKEAFVQQSHIFSDRPEDLPFSVDGERAGFGTRNGCQWRDHRRFAVTTFRELGVGKMKMGQKMMDEIQCFLRELSKLEGNSADISPLLTMSISNNICNLIFGKRFEYQDTDFQQMTHNVDEFIRIASKSMPRVFFPWLRYVPGSDYFTSINELRSVMCKSRAFIANAVKNHLLTRHEGQRNDYIHAYLTERENREARNPDDVIFSDDALIENAQGLFEAGSRTTQLTLRWAILYVMAYPDVQRKVQREIDSVIGKEYPTYRDRARTPYTEATLLEIGRVATISPIGVPHTNNRETTLYGYRIPAKSYVIPNLWSVHHDPELWDRPEEFRPERFLTPDGKQIRKPEYYIPFSIGKRSCMGELLASIELYLYFVCMLQKFTFKAPEGAAVSTEGKMALSYSPHYFETRAIERS